MPVKFKSDDKRLVRGTKKVITTKYFIKNTPKQELIDYINSSNAKPKVVQKCRNDEHPTHCFVVWVCVRALVFVRVMYAD